MKRATILVNKLTGNNDPDELDVIVQADEVEKNLNILGFITNRISVDLNLSSLSESLRAVNPDVVFNLVESIEGKAELIHIIPALLESLHIPFTGAGSFSLSLTSDKIRTKHLLSENKIPTAKWFTKTEPFIPDSCKYYIIKPVWEDGSVGISDNSVIAGNDNRIMHLLNSSGHAVFVEEYIHGREFNISVLGNSGNPEIFPPAEIQFLNYPAGKPHILNYNSKWKENSFEYNHSVRNFEFCDEDFPLLDEIKEISCRCWEILELSGYARIDFRVDEKNKPYVLEANANPCLSPDAGFIAASSRAGMNYKDVIEKIIHEAFLR